MGDLRDAIAQMDAALGRLRALTGGVWAIENLCEGGRLTEDAARGMLMALYENQGLDEVEITPEPE